MTHTSRVPSLLVVLSLVACQAASGPPATLTLAVTGSGRISSFPAGIDCGTTCAHVFSVGETIALAAEATDGAVLTGWSVPGCSGALCLVTLEGDTAVTASFGDRVPLEVSIGGTGRGRVSSDVGDVDCAPGQACRGEVTSGGRVTLTATAAPGFSFGGWFDGPCSGTAPTCTVTATEAVRVRAVFSAVLFLSDRALNGGDSRSAFNVWTSGTGGEELRPLTFFQQTSATPLDGVLPSFSADGTVLALSSRVDVAGLDAAGPRNAWLVDAVGARMTPITRFVAAQALQVQLAKDASRVWFLSDRDPAREVEAPVTDGSTRIWTARVDGSELAALTTSLPLGGIDVLELSPDGTRFAVLLRAHAEPRTGEEAQNLWVVNVDGSDAKQLTTMPGAYTFDGALQWAPDSRRIAYLSHQDPADPTAIVAHQNLWVVEVATGRQRPLTALQGIGLGRARWSPDGSRLAFDSNLSVADSTSRAEAWNVWTVAADTGALKALTRSTTGAQRSPEWTVDGTALYFTSSDGAGLASSGHDLWTIDAEGTRPATPITRLEAASSLTFGFDYE